ncbi:hypothetical protein [Photobacterium leiognathi]|uniref:hypothetical protein n=1 Tax=Photobacterium leiognathi TaxID=553611 RepID=UPI002738C80A|nr:hypothetical protein [Photobacterium leiognathi]
MQGEYICEFYKFLLANINKSVTEIEKEIDDNFDYIDIKKKVISFPENPHGKFKMHHKNFTFIRERMANEILCPLCKRLFRR